MKKINLLVMMAVWAVVMQAAVSETPLLRFGPNYLDGWTYHRANMLLTRENLQLNRITLFTSTSGEHCTLESPQFDCEGIDSLRVEIDYKLDPGFNATKVAPQVDLLDADGTVVSTVTGSVEAAIISQTITVTLPVSLAGDATLLFSAPRALESEGTFPAVKGIRVWVLLPDVTPLPGDVNGDGTVDVADVNSIINIMLGKEEVTPTLLSQADLTGDGNVDVSDVNAVINAMLGRR